MAFDLLTGPAGSEKKQYILKRFREALRTGIDPKDILFLCNSSDTAADIRSRIIKDLGSFSEIWIENVSSFCKKLLRENYHSAGLKPNFKVISDFEKRLIIRNILGRDIKLSFLSGDGIREGLVREISNFIDTAKRNGAWNQNISLLKGVSINKFRDIELIMGIYGNDMQALNCLDFTDLAIHASELLSKNKNICSFRSVFLYEAEDFDMVTADIIFSLIERTTDSVVSLSPDQSIFGFRGACPEYILDRLLKEYKFGKIDMKADIPMPAEYAIEADNRHEQAASVVRHMASLIKQGVNPRDIAVISRSVGENLWVFTDEMKKRGINHMMLGGIGFFRQPEIVELMSLLSCISDAENAADASIYRCMRMLGILREDILDILRNESKVNSVTFSKTVADRFPEAFKKFSDSMDEAVFKSSQCPVEEFMYWLLVKFNFIDRAARDEFSAQLYSYFYCIVEDYAKYLKYFTRKSPSFNELMKHIWDVLSGYGKDMDIPYSAELENVKIMTVQQSKSKIFDTVYIIDMTEDNFPRPFYENPLVSSAEYKALGIEPVPGIVRQYESEKRIFDIAATRATNRIIYCWYNVSDQGSQVSVSTFIRDKCARISRVPSDIIVDRRDLLLNIIDSVGTVSSPEIMEFFLQNCEDNTDILNILKYDEALLVDMVDCSGIRSFSPSALESYCKCPRKYFYNHVLRINEPSSVNSLFGSAVHEVLANIFSAGPEEIDIPGVIDSVWREAGFSSSFEQKNMRLIARDIISRYITVNAEERVEVVAVEEAFEIQKGQLTLRGRIDRIDRLSDGKLRVVDYKTSKNSRMTKALMGDVERGDNFQIPVYKWGKNPDIFYIEWLRKTSGTMSAVIDFSDDEVIDKIRKAEDNLVDTVDRLREGLFPAESDNCRTCYFSRICEA